MTARLSVSKKNILDNNINQDDKYVLQEKAKSARKSINYIVDTMNKRTQSDYFVKKVIQLSTD